MERLVIELPDRWLKFSRSPASVVVAVLVCLALSFAPVYLFILGREGASYRDPRVVACFAAIFLVPLIYIRLATLCITQVRAGMDNSGRGAAPRRSTQVLLWSTLTIGAIAIYFLLHP